MKPYCNSWPRISGTILLVLALAAPAAEAGETEVSASKFRARPNDAATLNGFDHFYNLDYDGAIRDFESSLQTHPNDPFAANHLLVALLFRELYRGRALDPDLYVSDKFVRAKQIAVEPAVQERIKALIKRILDLATERLQANPGDVDALYARGITLGIQATYTGLIEKSWFAALRSGLGAYKDHKQVLKLSPGYSDAKLVVGMYNYIVGSLPWHMKAAAFLLAITGSKSEGIQYLYDAANGGGEASVDAKSFLGVFLSREHRYSEAIPVVRTLHAAYPHNFLFALGEANLLRKSGQLPEAAAAYRKLLALQNEEMFRDAPMELAAYGLGETLRSQNDFAGATAAYDLVHSYPRADPRIASAAQSAVAEMHRLAQDRQNHGR